MIESKKITVGDMEFQLNPLPSLKAIRLDKKVITLLIPAIGGIKDLSLEGDIDLGAITKGLSESLSNMDDKDFEATVVELLSSIQYLPAGKAPVELTGEIINTIFMGKINLIYKLIIEVMRFNKFSPFVLVGDGNVIQKILSSTSQTKKEKGNGSKSERLGGLLET